MKRAGWQTAYFSYAVVRKDHEYLWLTYGPAADMTGEYEDQRDLKLLLETPTKTTAAWCYQNQIQWWFEKGPEMMSNPGWEKDRRVFKIAARYCAEGSLENLLHRNGFELPDWYHLV